MSVAVFVNPHSRANRRDPGLAARFAAILGDAGRVVTPGSLDDLGREARRLAQTPPAVIGIHGGDGTLHTAISALIGAFGPDRLPPVAVLPGGTMNVVASSLRIRVAPERLLAELADRDKAGRPLPTLRRRCLQVGDSYGFVFGNGLMASFLERYYAGGGSGAIRAVEVVARTLGSALVDGPYARQVFRGFRGRVLVDGDALPWPQLTGVGAATVREVGLGFKLNHRADEDPNRFSLVAIHAGPLRLAADLVPVQLGLGIASSRAFSTVAAHVAIEPEEDDCLYTVDGDLYRATGRLDIRIGPELRFVVPGGRHGDHGGRGDLGGLGDLGDPRDPGDPGDCGTRHPGAAAL